MLTTDEDDLHNASKKTAATQFAISAALGHINECIGAQPIGSLRRKNMALVEIAFFDSLMMSTDLPNLQTKVENDIYRSTCLINLLIEAFPNVFYKPENDVFAIRGRGIYSITDYVCDALGLNNNLNEAIGTLNTHAFNVVLLDKLYEDPQYTNIGNARNPLWPLLKMIKPVDETFTLASKIEAYQDVIQLILKGRLTLNNTSSLSQAHALTSQLHKVILKESTLRPENLTKNVIDKLSAIESFIPSPFIIRVYKKISSTFIEHNENKNYQMEHKHIMAELKTILHTNKQSAAKTPPPPKKPPKPRKQVTLPPEKPPRPNKAASTRYKELIKEKEIHSDDVLNERKNEK